MANRSAACVRARAPVGPTAMPTQSRTPRLSRRKLERGSAEGEQQPGWACAGLAGKGRAVRISRSTPARCKAAPSAGRGFRDDTVTMDGYAGGGGRGGEKEVGGE